MAKEFTLLAHAARNLRRRPTRAVILVTAIGLLVSVLVFALLFVRRVDAGVRAASGRLGADILIVPTGSRGEAEDVLLDNRVKTFYMDADVLRKIRSVPGIERATAQTYVTTIQGVCCDVPEALVVAFDQETDFVVGPWLAAKLDRKLRPGEAVVGADSAFNIRLGLTEVSGRLFGSVFRIVRVLDRTGTGLDNAIFVDAESAREALRRSSARIPPGSVSVVFAKVAPGEDPSRIAGVIEDSFVEVDAVARRDVGQGVLRALGDVSRIFVVTFLLASILAACLTWAVFSGIASERAREVGLMRAMGARESYVSRLFLAEVLLVGAVGSALGVLAGTGLSVVLVKGFAMLRNVSADLGAADRLAVGAIGLVVGTAVCVVGALSPLRSTRRTEPLSVLKGD